MSDCLRSGTVLGGRWRLGTVIGEGACGKVYSVNSTLVANPSEGYDMVIKVIPTGVPGKPKLSKIQERVANTLNYEYMLYTGLLLAFDSKPRLPDRFYGVDQGVRYLVMERLEQDLVAYASQVPRPTIEKIADIGLQIFAGLKWFHEKGFLFVDVKPQNFMLKRGKLYFVDYGLVERWVSYNSNGARAIEVQELAGTPSFCGSAVLTGCTPARRDDLEAMALTLLSLTADGTLPWSSASTEAQLRQMRQGCDIRQLAVSCRCDELADIIVLSKGIEYADRPPYDAIEVLLQKMRARGVGLQPTAAAAIVASSVVCGRPTLTASSSPLPLSSKSSIAIASSVALSEKPPKPSTSISRPVSLAEKPKPNNITTHSTSGMINRPATTTTSTGTTSTNKRTGTTTTTPADKVLISPPKAQKIVAGPFSSSSFATTAAATINASPAVKTTEPSAELLSPIRRSQRLQEKSKAFESSLYK